MDWTKASLSLKSARTPSSSINGRQSAAEKGHPRMPATANQKMPRDVLRPPRQFIKDEAPSMHMHMAKLEGRKAVLA